ncbi:MAG: hypothetical protein ABI406_17725 [Ktedonobacteraceae bacterium]
MHYEPRNTEASAKFIEAGGLKSWGCFAFLLVVLVLVLLFVLVHALLIHLFGEPVAWWGSVIFLIGVATGSVYLWIRTRRKQRREQELVWQRAMGNGLHEKKP